MLSGQVTIPVDNNFEKETLEIMKRWGADAARDCDGTSMPQGITESGCKIYSTYLPARNDNAFARTNDERPHFYLLSNPVIAEGETVNINFLDGYFTEQVVPEYKYDVKKWWEVRDRTSGQVVKDWQVDSEKNIVTVKGAKPFHEYTVSFLAKAVWDSTQIYNYITNNWTKDKDIPFEVRGKKTGIHILDLLKKWLEEHKEVDVVRFTTFFYHFTLVFNDKRKEKFVDWFGYSASVSVEALEQFEKEYGYALTPEDIIDEGYYNSPFRVPTKRFLDYMDFTERYVCSKARELADAVRSSGKESMMFLGDTWIGTEPYGKYFSKIGLDAVVGSVGSGVTVRMLSEIEGVKYTEGRFLPYFFPDTFYEGNDPCIELNKNWMTARRAIMRKPLDRIGFGGYLRLAAKFPDFIERVGEICDEFRKIYSVVNNKKPYCTVKAAILNCWGKKRSWMCHMVAHELWYQQIYSYQGVLEAVSGLPVDLSFINFEDIKNGALDNYDVILNVGDAYTAFSGGANWVDEEVLCKVREYLYNGGGFIGIGEPTAYLYGGKYFQLKDALGVDKELGFSLSTDKYNIKKINGHFIAKDVTGEIDYGEGQKNIYAAEGAEVIDIRFSDRFKRDVNIGEVLLAANSCNKGKCVYIAGLPYNAVNSRLLYRAMLFAANKENELYKAFSSNINTECHYYPDSQLYAVINNGGSFEKTVFYDINGNGRDIELKPFEILWIK